MAFGTNICDVETLKSYKKYNSPSKLTLTHNATSKFTTYEIIYLIHITTMKPFFSKLKTSFNKLTIFFCRRSTI